MTSATKTKHLALVTAVACLGCLVTPVAAVAQQANNSAVVPISPADGTVAGKTVSDGLLTAANSGAVSAV